MSVCMKVYAYKGSCSWKPDVLILLELELPVVMGFQMWVLGSE